MNQTSYEQRGTANADILLSLTYCSRAAGPVSPDDLRTLEGTAERRNRSEGVTGMLVYDDGHFFQWLEGPAEGMARVWESIQRDTRHADIRVGSVGPTQDRMFGDQGMKILRRGDPLWSSSALRARTLPHLVKSVVVPALAAQRVAARHGLPPSDPRVTELANLLIATNPTTAADLARELIGRAGSLAISRASLFDPTARRLGDLWYDDDCSSIELDLGLNRIQVMVREVAAAAKLTGVGLPAVLVAPQPGESHLLGATLDAELLWQAGWDAQAEFPATDAALDALVAGAWFDAVALSLSMALRREDLLARVAQTVAKLRLASRNPALVVVVGGRVFAEQDGLGATGADVNGSKVLELGSAVEVALRRPRSTARRSESAKSRTKRNA